MSDKALKKVSPINRFLDQPNGYIELKEKLLSGQLEQKRSSSLEDLFTRRQRRNESPSQFAQALKDLAGYTFKSEDNLKSLFHKGLSSSALQAITARKMWDPKERMSFDQLASYTDTEEDAIRMSANLLKSYQGTEEKTHQFFQTDSSSPYGANTHRNTRSESRPEHRSEPRNPRNEQRIQQPYRNIGSAASDGLIDKPKCYYCQEKGHLARDCSKKQEQSQNQYQPNQFIDHVKTSFQTPDNSDIVKNQRNPIIASMGQQPESKTSPAITGKVLFNQVVVPYLCDTGADLTVISRAVYERMNTPKEPVLLRVYSGPRIKSFDNKISKVLGAVCVKKCAVAKDCVVKNAKVLVLEDIPQYKCIMGRDLIKVIFGDKN